MIRRFFRGLWRAITALRLALANLLFLLILVLIWSVLSEKPEPLPERAALLLNPAGRVVEQQSSIDAAALLAGADSADSEALFEELIDSVKYASSDERIVALVMDLNKLLSIGHSRSTELAEVLADFRDTGKPIVAVSDYYTQDRYRLAAEADTVLMHPFGAVALEGYSYYVNFFASALDKLMVNMHVFRAGEYKSIAEPLIRDDMSPGEKAVSREWLGDIWDLYRSAIEQRRGLAPGSIQALLDDYPQYLRRSNGNAGRLALDNGLVDDLLDRAQQSAYLTALVGDKDEDGDFARVAYRDYLARVRDQRASTGLDKVAIVTAEGNIVPGEQPPGSIGGDSLASLLRATAERDDTKAIVLRINSGGGSVFASEVIRAELARIRDGGMPVVVSMGGVAASGGYYIATAADRILATPATITGSIGVFLAFPTVERLLERGGISTDGVATTAIAGGLRPDRPLAAPLEDVLQQSVDDLYAQFVTLVMESRQLDRESVERVAQGRVLSAGDALEAGLVDALGSLDAAVEEAAVLAGLAEDEYEVLGIQPALNPRQLLLRQLSDSLGGLPLLGAPLLDVAESWLGPARSSLELLQGFRDPRHLYMRCLACGI